MVGALFRFRYQHCADQHVVQTLSKQSVYSVSSRFVTEGVVTTSWFFCCALQLLDTILPTCKCVAQL